MSVEEAIEALVRRVVREELVGFAREFAKETASQRYVTVRKYAEARSISISTVRNAIRAGKLPAMRMGGCDSRPGRCGDRCLCSSRC